MYFPIQFRPKRRLFLANVPLLSVAFASALADPYPGEIGYLHKIDTNGIMSVSGGVLTVNGTPAIGDTLVSGTSGGAAQSYAHTAGRALLFHVPSRTTINSGPRFGFGASPTDALVTIGVDFASTTQIRTKDGVSALMSITLGAGDYQFGCIMRAVGGLLLYKVGAGAARLIGVWQFGTAALYAKNSQSAAAAQNYTLDTWRVVDFPQLADDWATAAVHVTESVSGTIESAAPADGWQQLAVTTLPASPSANQIAGELRYHVQDASNYVTEYLKRNAGNTAWDLLVDQVSAGSPTNKKTVTGVGTPARVMVHSDGTTHNHFTEAASAQTLRGTAVTISFQSTQGGIAAVWDVVATTIGSLDSFPLAHALFDAVMRD